MSLYEAFSQVYDALTQNVEYSKRAEFVSTLFNRYSVAHNADILDLACGTGSLTIELAKLGYSMIGVDISEDMLSEANNKMYADNISMLLLCQNMTQLDLYGTIDGAVCMLDSLNHLDCAKDVRKTIEKVGLFMNHGGIFIFDVNTIYKHREVLANNTFVYDCDDVYCVWQNTLNEDNSVEINLDIFEYDDGVYYRSEESFTERVYELEKIKEWLRLADFELIDIYDEMTDKKLCDTTERAVFVARYIGKDETDG